MKNLKGEADKIKKIKIPTGRIKIKMKIIKII